MEILLNIPVIFKILLSLMLILLINKFSKSILLSIFCGAFTLAFWSGHAPARVFSLAKDSLIAWETLYLLLVVYVVIGLSTQMSSAGVLRELVEIVRKQLNKRLSVAILPAIIGFLPMPGGALFSAPLVDDCDIEKNINPVLKARANYWFRHIWEFWWPLYPGVILAIALMGLKVWHFAMLFAPLTVVAVVSGYFFILRRIEVDGEETKFDIKLFSSLGRLVLPIIVVFVFNGLIALVWPGAAQINKYVPMIISVIIAMIFLNFQRPQSVNKWVKILFNMQTFLLCLLILNIRIYSGFIEADLPTGVSLITQLKLELDGWGIPVAFMMGLIPFLSGLTIGYAVGLVGVSFPIVVSLLGNDPTLGESLRAATLAYGFGVVGLFLSPVHACMVVTCEYFKTSLLKSVTGLAGPAASIALAVLVIYSVIGVIM